MTIEQPVPHRTPSPWRSRAQAGTALLPACVCLISLAIAAEVVAQDETFENVFSESFEAHAPGPFVHGTGGWSLTQQANTAASIEVLPAGGKALRLFDNHVAASDATCLVRKQIETMPGRVRVRLRMMLRKGEADGVNQDMGLRLLHGRRMLLALFFSSGELKTRQGSQWVSLDPPVKWKDGRWYELDLTIDPGAALLSAVVDGMPRRQEPLAAMAPRVTQIELTSQRYAQGELWIDDVHVAHEPPAELRTTPSQSWLSADQTQRCNAWFADEKGALDGGWLTVDGTASMRRLLPVDMNRMPLLVLDVKVEGDVDYSIFAVPGDGGNPQAIELKSSTVGRREVDLCALTGWRGKQQIELRCYARGQGRISVSSVEVTECPEHAYLAEPESVWHFVRPSRADNAIPEPVQLHVTGSPGRLNQVTQGVPFPAGMLQDAGQIVLTDSDGIERPCQAAVLSVWPDGSVRWLLIDTQLELPETGQATLRLEARARALDPQPMAMLAGENIIVDTEALRLEIPRNRFGRIDGFPNALDGSWNLVGRFDGRSFRASRGIYAARLETNGPLRSTVVLDGTLSDGDDSPFAYELRFTMRRGRREVEVSPTFTLVCDASEVQLQEMTLSFEGAFAPGDVTTAIDGAELRVARGQGQPLELLQDARNRCALLLSGEEHTTGKQAEGWLNTGCLSVAVRRFPQQFAKRLVLTDRELRLELWTPVAKPRRFGRGAAKTHDLLLGCSDGTTTAAGSASWANAFEHPPMLWAGAEWTAASGGIGSFAVPSLRNADLDGIFQWTLDYRMQERERRGATSYGMVHFGEISHINNEIDANKAFFLQWLRTGERSWLEFALDWAQHSQDIDVCHYNPNPRRIGIHQTHYNPDHNNGRISLTHSWIEGMLLRYYLTGDRRSLMTADLTGRAFVRSIHTDGRLFDAGNPSGGMGSRGYGRACWALCELYRATHNPRYTWAMKRLLTYLTAGLREDGAVPASHDGGGNWNPTDECPHMAAICAVGIARYTDLTGDRTFLPALERLARWQMARGMVPEKLGIMYHNRAGSEALHFMDACADMLEAWAFLYEATGDALYRDIAESVYDTLIEQHLRWRRDWTMAVVNVLIYLRRRQGWPERTIATAGDAGRDGMVRWLQSCQNADGGFGMTPGLPSDMDSAFRAVDALRVLNAVPMDVRAATDWILSCRNTDAGFAVEPGWHSNIARTWSALAALRILGLEPPEADRTAAWLQSGFNADGGCGSCPITGPIPYHPAWRSSTEYTSYCVQALELLETKPPDAAKAVEFLRSQQTEDGGFRHRGGGAVTGHTMDALGGLAALGESPRQSDACVAWLSSLRRDDGGYGWPGSSRSTLRNTAHCILALAQFGHLPADEQARATIAYVQCCRSAGGGFGHRPGFTPTVMNSWYAVRTLEALNALRASR